MNGLLFKLAHAADEGFEDLAVFVHDDHVSVLAAFQRALAVGNACGFGSVERSGAHGLPHGDGSVVAVILDGVVQLDFILVEL